MEFPQFYRHVHNGISFLLPYWITLAGRSGLITINYPLPRQIIRFDLSCDPLSIRTIKAFLSYWARRDTAGLRLRNGSRHLHPPAIYFVWGNQVSPMVLVHIDITQ